ncbi:MAG: hypothetical protein KDD89_17335, partial [Anaerolineales bacterium]|nr:hypothetical protein [Anaerolineales bacterium]
IELEGHLDASWLAEFEGLQVVLTNDGETHLTGPLVDQAALHGLLRRIRDWGIALIAVQRLYPVDGADRNRH